jgi:EAL domain-containing protein (putative c-di-GMP-specific phosphodiesterase class I)
LESAKLILIIEDEPDFVDTMRFFLENSNFRVISALTAEDGLVKAGQNPDLILLDLNIPGSSGHDVCRRLKENSVTQHIPVVMLTSQTKTLDKVEAFNLGVADYIGKHFSFEEILARIKAVLRDRSPEVSSQVKEERNKRIMELRQIIESKEIRTFYQPIVVLSTRQPMGYEALTRGPKMSFLENPINLFSLATEVNMLFELESLCLGLALKRSGFISEKQILFLNIDPLVINAGYFKNTIPWKDSLVTPSQVSIEITERTCVKNFEKLSSELSYFRSMGVKISIDDAGEGYSSLNAIAELKPEFIKVNMNLVRNVNADSVKNSLIQVMAELAKKLNSQLVAEGIETEEEYQTLLGLGIEYGQGYLFAKPSEHA